MERLFSEIDLYPTILKIIEDEDTDARIKAKLIVTVYNTLVVEPILKDLLELLYRKEVEDVSN